MTLQSLSQKVLWNTLVFLSNLHISQALSVFAARPNQALQATANSVRSCLAPLPAAPELWR